MTVNAQIAAALTDVSDGYIERTADPPKKGRNLPHWILLILASLSVALLAWTGSAIVGHFRIS